MQWLRGRSGFSGQLIVLLALLWLALTDRADWAFGAVAVALALAASLAFAPLQLTRFSLPGLVRFLVFFGVQSVAGGVDVARRALHPALPLVIHDCAYPLGLRSGQARTVFIASVSLLPGTLARELDGESLMVHSIAGDPTPALDRLQRRVADLFGLTVTQVP